MNHMSIQDFCASLNLPTSEDKFRGPLEVRALNNDGLGQLVEGKKRSKSVPVRKKIGSADELLRKGRPKIVDVRRSYSLSGRTKKFPVAESKWDYHPKVIDLSVPADVEKLALDLFTNGLQAAGETLEKTIERIYGGEDSDRCFEFMQVGNCRPFATQKVNVITRTLPEIAVTNERDLFGKNSRCALERKPKIRLPSIFKVSYSRPLTLQTKKHISLMTSYN